MALKQNLKTPHYIKMQDQQQQPTTSNYNKNKILTLIGSLLIQFSAGLIPVWGNANLYFLSYFKNNHQHVDKNSNSWILLTIVVPMAILIVFSTKLSNYFGYTNFIKACSIIYVLSYFVIYIQFNMVICTIFLLIIPITVNSMSLVPMYNCLWTYFMDKKSTVTGYALVSYGVSGAIFNIVFLQMINPSNRQATLNENGFVYFDQSVTRNLLPSTKVIYLIVGMIFIVGAWMVRNEQQEQEKYLINSKFSQNKNNSQQNNAHHYQLKQQVDPAINQPQPKPQYQKYQNQNNTKQQPGQIQLMPYKQFTGSPSPLFSTQSISHNPTSQQMIPFSLRRHLFDWKFLIIFSNVLFIDLYATFLISNFKLIFIDSINDDHFLGYCLVLNTISALIGTFLWGCLADKWLIGKTMLAIIILDLLIKLFGIFSTTKPTLMMLMFLIGFTSRAMSTIAGPGLIQVFGLKIATQLLPMKALAVIGSTILVPILQLIFLGFMTPFKFMTLLIFINIFLLFSTYYFNKHFNQSTDTNSKQQQQQEKQRN